MENCLLAIFDEIWPKSLYYSTGSLARFLSNFKNLLKSNFDSKLLKLSIYHKNMYMYMCIRKIIKVANSLLAIFDKIPCVL